MRYDRDERERESFLASEISWLNLLFKDIVVYDKY